MILFVFECSHCKQNRRHITPALAELGSYQDHCIYCSGVQTFTFSREEKMTTDWFTTVAIPNVIKVDEDLLYKSLKKDKKDIRVAS